MADKKYIQYKRRSRTSHLSLPLMIGLIVVVLSVLVYVLVRKMYESPSLQTNVRIGVVLSPLDIGVKDGKLSGLQVDLIKLLPEISEKKKYFIIPYTSEYKAHEDLSKGYIQCLAGSELIASDSEKAFPHTQALYYTQYVLVAHRPEGRRSDEKSFDVKNTDTLQVHIPKSAEAREILLQHLVDEGWSHLSITKSSKTEDEMLREISQTAAYYLLIEKSKAKVYTDKLAALQYSNDLSIKLKHSWTVSPKALDILPAMDSVIHIASQTMEWEEVILRHGMLPIHK